jgi:hypothetical protein
MAPPRGHVRRRGSRTRPKRTSARHAAPRRPAGVLVRTLSQIRQRIRRGRGKRTEHRYRRKGRPLVLQVPLVMLSLIVAWWLLTALRQGHDVITQGQEVIKQGQDAIGHVLPHQPTLLPHPPAIVDTTSLTITGMPSLDTTRVNDILAAYHSPLQGQGKALVALSAQYKIDDAIALAFFVMESRAGTKGEAVHTRSFGNLRPMPGAPAADGYRRYDSWLEGATEWFQLIRTLYINTLKLTTVEQIIPIYAPASDNNEPAVIVAGIHQLVSCWRGDADACPDTPSGIRDLVAAKHG